MSVDSVCHTTVPLRNGGFITHQLRHAVKIANRQQSSGLHVTKPCY